MLVCQFVRMEKTSLDQGCLRKKERDRSLYQKAESNNVNLLVIIKLIIERCSWQATLCAVVGSRCRFYVETRKRDLHMFVDPKANALALVNS